MSRPVRLRLTACASTAAATVLAGMLVAPSAHASTDPAPVLPGRVADSSGVAQSKLAAVPSLGRKWG